MTAGEYSDYRVLAVFDSEAQADEACKLQIDIHGAGYSNGPSVEKLPFFGQPPIEAVRITCVAFQDYDPETKQYLGTTSIRDDGEERIGEWQLSGSGGPCQTVIQFQSHFVRMHVEGTDIERVRKVFSGKRAQLLACPWITMTEDQVADALGGQNSEDMRW